MTPQIIFFIVTSALISVISSIVLKTIILRTKRYFLPTITSVIAAHAFIVCVFTNFGYRAGNLKSYLILSSVNILIIILVSICLHQIARLRLARDPVKGALLSAFLVLVFSWVLFAGAGNGHGAGVLPLPAIILILGAFYYELQTSLDAFVFASALAQTVLVYALFHNGIHYHMHKNTNLT